MKASSNARWIGVSQAARIVSQVLSIAILARFLSPSDYGLMALATIATNLALLFRDFGTAAAVIQRENLSDETTVTVFWLNVAMGSAIAIVLVALAGPLETAFNAPGLRPVLCVLAITFPVVSLTSAQKALLERDSKFRTLARIEVIAALCGVLAAIVAAWIGLGVFSLVLQALVFAVFSSVQIWLASPWRPKGKATLAECRGIFGFSGPVAGFQLFAYLFRNADSMIIGRYLGTGELGLYSIGYKLMLFPVQNLTWVATRALYPIMSRQQDAVDDMGRLYVQSLCFISFMTAPLMVGLFVLREPAILVMLGRDWHRVADLLMWLAPVGYLQSIWSPSATVFMARGYTKLLMGFTAVNASIHITAFAIGVQAGIEGVAAGYLAASVVIALGALHLSLKLVNLSLSSLVRALWIPFGIAIITGVAVAYFVHLMQTQTGQPLITLAGGALIGAATYLGLNLLCAPARTKMLLRQFLSG